MNVPDWMADAKCGQLVKDGLLTLAESDAIFFDCGNPSRAQNICETCPVQAQCKGWAEDRLIPHGVFGGEQGASRRARLGIDISGYPTVFVA